MTNTVENQEEEIFAIPFHNLERLHKEVIKLNRRAVKLGFPEMEIETIRTYEVPHPRYVELYEQKRITKDEIPMLKMRDVKIVGDAIKIEGYELMGTLDHYSIPGSVIVRTVPGQSIPAEFHNRDATCDHCGKIRNRIETFVLQEMETGKHIAVGRQCVRDFIGYNVAALARYLQRWRDLTDSLSDTSDERWYGGRYVPTFRKEAVLATTFGAIRVDGWRARSACAEDETPTSVNVGTIFEPPQFSGYRGAEQDKVRYQDWVARVRESQEDDIEAATKAMEWLVDQPDGNEYMHNLKVLNEAEGIPMNMFGYWCSLAAAYLRHEERLKLQSSERKTRKNEWVGDIKERREFVVEIVSIRSFEGRSYSYYQESAVVRLHRMIDDAGRTLVWFANTDPGMKEGKTYKIKGTVKKHDEYKDWKQTVLNRVAVIEEVETEEAA